jgi:hypothetical protein
MAGMARYVPRMPEEDDPIPAELNLRCLSCGYALTGLTERRCPECGTYFDPRETWRENERGTWEYHFDNVRSKREYAAVGYVALAGVAFVILMWQRPGAWLVMPLVALGEMYIWYSGGRGLAIRIAYATICVAWGVAVVILF